jgi:adenine-specific DNA-methyltransferase
MCDENSYVSKQIIAYIGNKRRLLSLIQKAIDSSGITKTDGLTFLDLFSGSGVVSRFAKTLGCEVYCNDWEEYAEILSLGFVQINKKDIAYIFGNQKRFDELIKKINNLPAPKKEEQYIAKYYAPAESDVDKADFRTERLFYTHENALAIDKIRNYIEENFPRSICTTEKLSVLNKANATRNLLLSLLLYEAATHTNTSGVFKAFHKGFGGHGKDALSRILASIQLHEPVLVDSKYSVHVFRDDANELVKKLSLVDIAYLDPPYNQHQYGSNYHLLNTIAKWDKIPEPMELNEKGVLKNKAAIRSDWVNTRSAYCYKKTAIAAFTDLIQNLKAKQILISYSSDGIIPFNEMKKICLSKGYVSIITSDYTKYRGGKQSNKRQNSDIEFILAIDTSKKSTAICAKKIDEVIEKKKVLLLFKRKYNRQKLAAYHEKNESNAYEQETDAICIFAGTKKIKIETHYYFEIDVPDCFDSFTGKELKAISTVLEECVCSTKEEELEQLIAMALDGSNCTKKYTRQIPATIRKLAQKKYKSQFEKMLTKVEHIRKVNNESYMIIADHIEEIKQIAEMRFSS